MRQELVVQEKESPELFSFPAAEQRELRRLLARDHLEYIAGRCRTLTIITGIAWLLTSGFIMLGVGDLSPAFSRVDLTESLLWALAAWVPLTAVAIGAELRDSAPRRALEQTINADLPRRYRPHASIDCDQQWAPHSEVRDKALTLQCLAYKRDPQRRSDYDRRAGSQGEWALKIERQIVVDSNDPDQAMEAWEQMSALAAEREAASIATTEEKEQHLNEAHTLAAALRSY